MTPEHWQRVRQVLEQALESPAASRASFLAHACGSDDELRAEVESLLQHHVDGDSDFLEPSGVRLRFAPRSRESWGQSLIGRRIGQFTLDRLLATGGMGNVYEATQEQPRRAVAVKLLCPGLSAPAALARFRLEPHVLGRLQHPNIAQVFESGIHDFGDGPVPYFAMELIADALTLSEYATTRELNLRSRLELTAKTCDAVQHAHQKGVIHRDLKPANILVNREGEPKVIDFGVARASDADVLATTQHTHAGDLIGTIRYMSPEQCEGDPAMIDTRCDIYSLGVVLYELLTGVPPYDTAGKTTMAAIRAIRDDPPRRPSDVNRALRGNLNAILLKALEKNPAHRYSSAAEFAADLRRHLRGEPIEARPPSLPMRMIQWTIRHPLTVSVCISVLILTLSAAIGGAAYRYAITRPDRVELSDDRSRAQLLTWPGYPLRKWSNGPYRFAFFAKRPEVFGGGVLALLGPETCASVGPTGHVTVYDCDRSDNAPSDHWGLRTGDIPVAAIHSRRGNSDYDWTPQSFSVTTGILADVFDDPPGVKADELVCFIMHRAVSHGAICIFRLDGEMLYRIWIDNNVFEFHWASDPGVLVCYGANGEAFIEEREVDNPRRGTPHHPWVVFGIKPVLNELKNDYLVQEPSERTSVPHEQLPLWYHCILPLDAAHLPVTELPRGAHWLRTPETERCAKSAVLVSVYVAARANGVALGDAGAKSWLVDAKSGNVLEAMPPSDLYARFGSPKDAPDSKPFPPFDDWTLGELPAKKKKTSATSQSAPK